MATLAGIRGALLEEIVLYLLKQAGYSILDEHAPDIRQGHSGLELEGRGEKHQVDAIVSYEYTPAFIYPIRLIVEAKAYAKNIGIEVVRNGVGVLKDINENFFSYRTVANQRNYTSAFKLKRFNYTYAIFSINGYTANAQRYAIAHQIFLIQYKHVPQMRILRDLLFDLQSIDFDEDATSDRAIDVRLSELRDDFAQYLKGVQGLEENMTISEHGQEIYQQMKTSLNSIGGSYFGLLNGQYPIHIFSDSALPENIEDEEFAEVSVVNYENEFYMEFRVRGCSLNFELPDEIARFFATAWEQGATSVANTKLETIHYITLSGLVNGRRRSIKIGLDRDWLTQFLCQHI